MLSHGSLFPYIILDCYFLSYLSLPFHPHLFLSLGPHLTTCCNKIFPADRRDIRQYEEWEQVEFSYNMKSFNACKASLNECELGKIFNIPDAKL